MTAALGRVLVPLVLCVVTLGVFARLQDFGPEGAVRAFHQALAVGDLRRIDELTLEGAREPWASWYVQTVGPLVRESDFVRVELQERVPRRALVLSTLGRGGWRLSTLWEVALLGGRWRVQMVRVLPPYNLRSAPYPVW
jgi:hypothetical protein